MITKWEEPMMPVTSTQPRRLIDAELEQVLALAKDNKGIELKLAVPDSSAARPSPHWAWAPWKPRSGRCTSSTPRTWPSTATASSSGARRVQQRGDDSVVKLRPVVPGELPDGPRRSRNLVVEVDAMAGGYLCSASLKATLEVTDVKDVAAGRRAIRDLYSKEQRAFFTAHAPDGIGLEDLSVLGRITVANSNSRPRGTAVGWSPCCGFTPASSPILELSTKCPPTQGSQVASETRAFLSGQGVDSSAGSKPRSNGAGVLCSEPESYGHSVAGLQWNA
jgi:hypothetical protein